MPWSLLLVPVSVILIFVYFQARTTNNEARIAWIQPGLTVLSIIIALLGLTVPAPSAAYIMAIVVALAIATVGDIYNVDMANPNVVIRGLVIFCFAYLTYGVGFWAFGGFHQPDLVVGGVSLVLYGLFVAFFWTETPQMRLPVMIYAGIMFFMLWRGVCTFFGDAFSTTQAILITAGTSVLLIGDFEFSVHFFKRPLRIMYGPFLYAGGQLLIALSCSFPR